MDCLKNCVIIIPAKLCNQRQFFSHNVELNNKGILHLHLHLLFTVFADYTFWHTKYELSLTIDIDLLHVYMYHLSVLPPKQHNISLIVSRQISIANVSPNLTDAHNILICVLNVVDDNLWNLL